jgi:hypothetical protein
LAIVRTNDSVLSHVAAAGSFSPPTTIKVLIAGEGLMALAHISTPDELRTAPGATAKTLIDGGMSAKRAAISNTEIGPAASSSWKSGNTRMPITICSLAENDGNTPFETSDHHVRMPASSLLTGQLFKGKETENEHDQQYS